VRVAFITLMYKTKDLLDLIHTDVYGFSLITSIGGACYYVTFIDNFHRRVIVFLEAEIKGISEV